MFNNGFRIKYRYRATELHALNNNGFNYHSSRGLATMQEYNIKYYNIKMICVNNFDCNYYR